MCKKQSLDAVILVQVMPSQSLLGTPVNRLDDNSGPLSTMLVMIGPDTLLAHRMHVFHARDDPDLQIIAFLSLARHARQRLYLLCRGGNHFFYMSL